MMSGIDASFAGAIFTGYHSSSNTDASPLCHTMNLDNVSIRINGIQASELVINTFAAALYDVPVLLVTGDLGVCEQASVSAPRFIPFPSAAAAETDRFPFIRQRPSNAFAKKRRWPLRTAIAHPEKFAVALPNNFDVEVEFVKHNRARRASFYPGVKQIGPRTVRFSSDAYYDVLRFFMFCL